MARLEEYNTNLQFKATVKETTRLTSRESDEEVRELILDIDRKNFTYKAGQSIGVLVPGPHSFGNKTHHRLYTVADLPNSKGDEPRVTICVKRVTYIDEYSGERYKGVASHYICDLKPGDEITITGPFGIPFPIPEDKSSDMLLIGMGTGIAPFRAFVKHIYKDIKDWKGRVRLFYGAHTGLELLYMNDQRNDFANYYDEQTFKAFQALSPRPHWADPIALDYAIQERSEEIVNMMENSKTHVYVAGLEKIKDSLETAFANIMGSADKWERRKAELVAGKRWIELLY